CLAETPPCQSNNSLLQQERVCVCVCVCVCVHACVCVCSHMQRPLYICWGGKAVGVCVCVCARAPAPLYCWSCCLCMAVCRCCFTGVSIICHSPYQMLAWAISISTPHTPDLSLSGVSSYS